MLAPLLSRFQQAPGMRALVEALRAGASARDHAGQQPGAVRTLSVLNAAKPAALAALHAALDRPMLLIAARPERARALADELALWMANPEQALRFPATDALPYEPLPPDPDQTAERVAVLSKLAVLRQVGVLRRAQDERQAAPLIVTSVRALADKLMRPIEFNQVASWLRVGQRISPRALMETWLRAGYEPTVSVEAPGEFAHRGGIVDVFPVGRTDEQPATAYRIEFWGDGVESIRPLDPVTQRSTGSIQHVFIPPAYEVLGPEPAVSWPEPHASATTLPPSARLHIFRGTLGCATLLDHLPSRAMVVLDEPGRIAECWTELETQAEELRVDLTKRGELPGSLDCPYLPWREVLDWLQASDCQVVTVEHDPERETLASTHAPVFAGRMRHFLDHLERTTREEQSTLTVIVSQQTARLGELMGERGIATVPTRVALLQGSLTEGWRSQELGLELFTDGELFGVRKIRRPVRRTRRAAVSGSFLADIAEGDLVVHVDHGIGRFRGLIRMANTLAPENDVSDGAPRSANGGRQQAEREYLLLEYSQGDRLYVPIEQADRVARYMGGGDDAPSLTRLDSGEWARAKQRVRRAVRDIARELLELYAARAQAEGYAFEPDAAWQAELEASFPFVETPDQMAAILEVKADMERPQPMDRLLVGDVGYGKTEVALRAAFKAVLSGKQVAVLVPTTVLAQQHYNTFRERLAAFPVRVEVLSRFRSVREQRRVVEGLAAGTVDICIGTHRLVQKDVRIKDLGLVIIDEEQRFGVTHKERLKQLRKEVDVLTLTATPIPRTLHMALSGVRDMSTIETAPEARVPVRTYVSEYDEGLVREALVRELERGGQVYLVHNRVQGIERVARQVKALLPDARVGVAHGQMHEDQLERTMLEFADGDIDVLVSTTIIESGLDIPNVNTIIINNAHYLGLAQLYQLRGRVGRAAARAYAYFFYTRDEQLTEAAEQRLRTIFEATELGAGFRIAMKDLEIRGAGNLLGAEQSGHIAAVGFELYTRLLGEAVEQIRDAQEGEPHPAIGQRALPSAHLPLAAYLPGDFVPDEHLRLNLYRRLAAATDGPELGALVDELEDRFGPLPEPAQNLAYLIGLRISAGKANVEEITTDGGQMIVRFSQMPRVDTAALAQQLGVPLRVGSNQLRFPLEGGSVWMPTLLGLVERCAQNGQSAEGRRNSAARPVATTRAATKPKNTP